MANFDKTMESVIGEALLSAAGLFILKSNQLKTISFLLLIIN